MLPPAKEVALLIPATFDPPVHTSYRRPLNKPFSAEQVKKHEATIRALVVSLIDKVAAKGHSDFLTDVIEPFPPEVIFKIAGMPLDNLHAFRLLAKTFMSSPDAQSREQAYHQIGDILRPTVEQRMIEPKDDLLSLLVASDFDGRKLSMPEVLNYAIMLFLGGLDTVINALGFMIRHLAKHHELQQQLRNRPERIDEAMEELLRMYSIATPMRTATVDGTIAGIEYRKGDQFLLLLAAINYDPQVFSSAEQFCPHRKQHHVSFNTGHHRCIGANLGRLEMRIFLQEVLARIPTFSLDPKKPPVFSGGYSLSVESLSLVWAQA